jgi:site-specific DNA recombinase
MKKALTYARVSTDEQAKEGQSIEAQIKLCQRHADANGMNIVEVYKDEGKSGSNMSRPGLQALLDRVGSDKTIDYVLVLDTDRLARNTLDHLTIKAFLSKKGVQLISISQLMINDSPEGNFIDVVLAGANAFQSQITGRKTSKVLAEKAKMGWWIGWAPIGYMNVDNPNHTSTLDKRIIVPHPTVGPLITKLFQLYKTGTL